MHAGVCCVAVSGAGRGGTARPCTAVQRVLPVFAAGFGRRVLGADAGGTACTACWVKAPRGEARGEEPCPGVSGAVYLARYAMVLTVPAIVYHGL